MARASTIILMHCIIIHNHIYIYTGVLYMCEQFIEEAFQSRINEGRHIQLMYDKFRRYRKREEDKMAVRMAVVRRAGSVDSLEGKLQERGGQLAALQREVMQKDKVREE